MNDLDKLIGLTLSSIDILQRDDQLIFKTTCGRTFKMWHEQDCCENVFLAETIGDLQDLIGNPILVAREDTNEADSSEAPDCRWDESMMWTFYNFSTIKGSVTLRWWGSSNGYYSTGVSFKEALASLT